ncbi:MAG: replication-associated recombination protein A [Oscillospiraceae bacterium]|nr:replication-associated recombination protein A [Oscillospiraceae bacterium]MBQ3048883.1 replication-associated recombination protein A [Oscillospiraceae bacterium]MBQ9938709.1 replication-associated recombination protein A [Oscillospiraceae bacterium]
MSAPLADRARPETLDDVVGQQHILGEGGLLRRVANTEKLPNMIFYGPPGVGKTTVARILAQNAGKKLYKLNGTTASTADIKDIIERLDSFEAMNGVVLYLDEIQYLNKKQQQTLLEFIEDGRITLIASTTENPYFYVYSAILSRSTVFEFKQVEPAETKKALEKAANLLEEEYGAALVDEEGVLGYIAQGSGGDVRKALGALELCYLTASEENGVRKISLEDARTVSQRNSARYDRDGDAHYDLLSAFQKSIRGSDENAALHYLARLLSAGDLISPCRRLLVISAEDIGLAYPNAIAIVKSCVDSAMQLGLPEARIPLAEAVILLCTSPKSNSGICAIDAAMQDVENGNYSDVPQHLKDAHYGGAEKLGRGIEYKYPHSYPGNYVEQQYLPDAIKDRVYYNFGDNKTEQAALSFRKTRKNITE